MSRKFSTQKHRKSKKTGKIRKNKTQRKKKTFRKKNYSRLKKKLGKVFQRGGYYEEIFTVKNGIKEVYPDADREYETTTYDEVKLPDSVEKIHDNTFDYVNLQKLDLGNGVKVIGKNAFRGNKLEELKLPNSLVSIGEYAFADNPLLKSITMPSEFKDNIYDIFRFWNEHGIYYNIPSGYDPYHPDAPQLSFKPVNFTFTEDNEENDEEYDDDDDDEPPPYDESRQQIINTSN